MKKTYQKPVILIEDFTVTETIASSTYSCGVKATLYDVSPCEIQNVDMDSAWNRYGMFNSELACTMLPEMNEPCYHGAVLTS